MSSWNEQVVQELNLHENVEKIIENQEYEAHFVEIQAILRKMKKINSSESVKSSLKTILEEIIDITWNEKEPNEIEEGKLVQKSKITAKNPNSCLVTPRNSNKNPIKPASANCSPKGSIASKSSSCFAFNSDTQSPKANPSLAPYVSNFYFPKMMHRTSPKSISARKYHGLSPKLTENKIENSESQQHKILISRYYKKLSKLLSTK
ncbi:unnamed protein product [Blepharisma stoltei]|uniref:Uncharacterized protein n=1 Tax=Blepharisma stoltei TaxID=1481888 RepID=A0AAU9KFB5_9CILI|nr:unnamed protein product [Blepharisma stoltei]